MGMTVTVLSHSAGKKDEALKLGAKHFLLDTDKKEMAAAMGSFEVVLVTQNANTDLTPYLSLVATQGKLVLVAAPETPVKVSAFALLMGETSIVGSLIGSQPKIKSMLEFSAKHNIKPLIEKFDMADVNSAWKKVLDSSIRFRAVLVKSEKTFAKST